MAIESDDNLIKVTVIQVGSISLSVSLLRACGSNQDADLLSNFALLADVYCQLDVQLRSFHPFRINTPEKSKQVSQEFPRKIICF